jgi:hypothetical protein
MCDCKCRITVKDPKTGEIKNSILYKRPRWESVYCGYPKKYDQSFFRILEYLTDNKHIKLFINNICPVEQDIAIGEFSQSLGYSETAFTDEEVSAIRISIALFASIKMRKLLEAEVGKAKSEEVVTILRGYLNGKKVFKDVVSLGSWLSMDNVWGSPNVIYAKHGLSDVRTMLRGKTGICIITRVQPVTKNYAALWKDNNVIGGCNYIERGCTVLFWELKGIKSSDDEDLEKIKPCIIFPLLIKPLNDLNCKDYLGKYWGDKAGTNSATYNSWRNASRKYAGRDLYGIALSTSIVAICEGIVLDCNYFYNATYQVTILHTTSDGRKFIIRYGEVDQKSITVKIGQNVKQGQEIASIGTLINKDNKQNIICDKITNMLHLEYFTGSEGYDINRPLTTLKSEKPDNEFIRRKDVADPLNILIEGYKNVFSH